MLLEGWLPVLIVSKVAEQFLHSFSEAFVVGVNSELLTHELELIRDTVGMEAIAITKQEVALVVKTVVTLIGLVAHDVAFFFQARVNVSVDGAEPLLELRVTVGVTVDVIDGVEEVIGACVIGEAFDDGLGYC